MDNLDFRHVANSRISARLRQAAVLLVVIILGIIISATVNAQDNPGQTYHKTKARHYKSKFRTQISQYTNACDLLERKRTARPKSNIHLTSRKPRPKTYAEIDPPSTTAVTPKQQPVVTQEQEKERVVITKRETPEEKLEELHQREDKVLEENHLPKPTSEKHEQIRKQVAENIKNKKDNEPIELAPLYFTFDQDEFSVVDMDPFLVAVEYALQGKTILIEGHTDNRGADDYNLKLSLKRVQKIKQLMHEMGVPDERISVMGYGEEVSKHANISADGRQLNRRVDFKAF
ncbi:MAG TPA: OmpA family protein [Ohtaekwangia sp.]